MRYNLISRIVMSFSNLLVCNGQEGSPLAALYISFVLAGPPACPLFIRRFEIFSNSNPDKILKSSKTTTNLRTFRKVTMATIDPKTTDSFLPLAGLAQDGWSNDTEATSTCLCGAVQLAFVSTDHLPSILFSKSGNTQGLNTYQSAILAHTRSIRFEPLHMPLRRLSQNQLFHVLLRLYRQ